MILFIYCTGIEGGSDEDIVITQNKNCVVRAHLLSVKKIKKEEKNCYLWVLFFSIASIVVLYVWYIASAAFIISFFSWKERELKLEQPNEFPS